jgi:hypothetical protein
VSLPRQPGPGVPRDLPPFTHRHHVASRFSACTSEDPTPKATSPEHRRPPADGELRRSIPWQVEQGCAEPRGPVPSVPLSCSSRPASATDLSASSKSTRRPRRAGGPPPSRVGLTPPAEAIGVRDQQSHPRQRQRDHAAVGTCGLETAGLAFLTTLSASTPPRLRRSEAVAAAGARR